MDSSTPTLEELLIFSCMLSQQGYFRISFSSLGTTLFTAATWYNYVLGAAMILDALYNVLILFVHPAFKDGSRKITDDPTQAYTSGESVGVITMYLLTITCRSLPIS